MVEGKATRLMRVAGRSSNYISSRELFYFHYTIISSMGSSSSPKIPLQVDVCPAPLSAICGRFVTLHLLLSRTRTDNNLTFGQLASWSSQVFFQDQELSASDWCGGKSDRVSTPLIGVVIKSGLLGTGGG